MPRSENHLLLADDVLEHIVGCLRHDRDSAQAACAALGLSLPALCRLWLGQAHPEVQRGIDEVCEGIGQPPWEEFWFLWSVRAADALAYFCEPVQVMDEARTVQLGISGMGWELVEVKLLDDVRDGGLVRLKLYMQDNDNWLKADASVQLCGASAVLVDLQGCWQGLTCHDHAELCLADALRHDRAISEGNQRFGTIGTMLNPARGIAAALLAISALPADGKVVSVPT